LGDFYVVHEDVNLFETLDGLCDQCFGVFFGVYVCDYRDVDSVFCIEFFVNLFDLVEDDVVQDDLCFC